MADPILKPFAGKLDQPDGGVALKPFSGVLDGEAAAPGFIPTIKRTGGQMLTTAATSLEDVTGPNAVTKALQDTGQGIIDRNPAGIRSLAEAVNSPWLTVKESLGQFAPQIGAAAAGGWAGAQAGAALGSLAGPAGTALGGAVGGVAGGLLPIFTQEYGGIRQEQKESGQEDKARALAAAIPATALERFGMGKALKVFKGVPGGAAGTLAKEVAKGALKEGATEGAQNVIEQLGAFKDPTTGENLEDTALSAVMGGIGGGVMGGAAGAVDGSRHRAQQRADAQADQQAWQSAEAEQPDAPLQLGHTPDPLIVFPDGTTGRQSEVDAYLESLPQDQQTAARARLYGYAPQQADIGTFPGAADPNAPQRETANAPQALDATTSPGAAPPYGDGVDYQRDVDTSGLSLQDPAEVERARAATVDYEPGDATPQWDTEKGAAPARQGLDMPAPPFDTGDLSLDMRTPSQRMGIDPAAGPLSKAAATAVDSGAHQAQQAQFLGATGRDVMPRRTGPGIADDSRVIDVQGRVVEDAAIGTPRRLTAQESAREAGAQAFRDGVPRAEIVAIPNVVQRAQHLRGYDEAARQASTPNPAPAPALPPPRNLREGLERIRAQRQQAAQAAQSHQTNPTGVVPHGPQADQTQQGSAQPAQGRAAPAAAVAVPGAPAVRAGGQALGQSPSQGPLTDGAPPQNPGAQAAPAAGAQAAPPFTTVTTAKGRFIVRTADLNGDAPRLATFTAEGKPRAVKVQRADIAPSPAAGQGAAQEMRAMAQQFRERSGGTNATFARVLDQFAGEVEQGKRTAESTAQMRDAYRRMLAGGDAKKNQAPAKAQKAPKATETAANKGSPTADLAALYEANGPYPPSAATRIGEGQWLPAVKTGPSSGQPIDGAPTFSDASGAAAWAKYEQAKARKGADVAALQRLQDAVPGRVERQQPAQQAGPEGLLKNVTKGEWQDSRVQWMGQQQSLTEALATVQSLREMGESADADALYASVKRAVADLDAKRQQRAAAATTAHEAAPPAANQKPIKKAEPAAARPAAQSAARQAPAVKDSLTDQQPVIFERSGDFWNYSGKRAAEVAQALGTTLAERNGRPMVGVPEHGREAAARVLREAGIEAGFPAAEASPQDFIPAPGGGRDYGEITPEMGKAMRRQAGKIRLQQGVQNADGTGWGLVHIEANHGKQIRGLGFDGVSDFVAHVASGIQQVWQVPGNSQLLVTVKDGRKDVMYIQLEIAKEGDFYRVNSAFPVRQQDYESRQGMKKIWDGSEPTSAVTGQRPAFATAASASPETESSQGSSNARGQDGSVPPAPPADKPAPRAKPAIEDFGETLRGARKMLYAEAYADGMGQAKSLDAREHPLSKTWPEPDYAKLLEGGAAPEAVALVRALRDAVPTKPQAAWKLKGWADRMQALRAFAEGILAGRTEPAAVTRELERARLGDVANQAALYEAVGHERSLKGLDLSAGRYSMYAGVDYDPPRTIWTVARAAKGGTFGNWPRELAKGDTREAAIAAFKQRAAELLAQEQAPAKGASFEIYGKRAGGAREFFIGKKIGRNVAELKGGFADLKAARQYKADHQGELEELLAKYKAVPPVRGAQNAPRIGEDYRQGADVTPGQFQENFGFRGVQFGNYVEGSRRQQDLNQAYDALMDLAGVLNLPPKALSLDGRLGLAFGARGSGGVDAAAAHYERGEVVINLTKKQGAGSLAHEWWHALDNYFSRQRGDGGGFMTEESRRGDGVREEMRAAFREVVSTINRTGMQERSRKLDDRRTKEYWSTKPEMSARAFESYVIAKLQDQSAGNDYLANIVGDAVFALEGAYPYPTAGELPQIRGAFDGFFQTVQTKEGDDGRVALFSRSTEAQTQESNERHGATQQLVDALTERWTRAPEIIVARNMQDEAIPQRVRDYDAKLTSQGGSGEVRGFVYRGKVYLLSDHLANPRQIAETLFHEVLGHHGLRGAFGDRLDGILRQVGLARRADVVAKARSYGLVDKALLQGVPLKEATNAQVWAAMTPDQRLTAAEEVLAEMAEQQPQLSFVQRAVAAVRTFLRELGLGLQMTDAEIVRNYLTPAREFVTRQGETVEQAVGRAMEAAFSRANGEQRIEPVTLNLQGWDGGQAQLRALAGAWYSENLQGKSFRNDDMGVDVQFSSDGKRTAFATSGNLRVGWRAEMVKALPELVKRAVKVDENVPDARRAHDTRAFHTLAAPLQINGRVLTAKITLREALHDFPGKRHKFYDIAALEIENGPEMSGAVPDRDAGPLRPTGSEPSGVTVAQLAQAIKPRGDEPLFSRTAPQETDTGRDPSWTGPAASSFDDMVYKLQDKHIDTKRVLEGIRAAGIAIGDDKDVYLREELYHERAAKRTEDFIKDELQPLVDWMQRAGLTMPMVEEYLHARHAKEANAVIAQRNDKLPDGGSGMTNAEADAVLASFTGLRRVQLEKAAERVDAIIRGTRQAFVDYGLEDQATVDGWAKTYQHYVPLMREQEGDGMAGLGTGQGFSVKGRETKGRTGSTRKVVDIIANVVMQRERAIVRGEKNRVAQAAVGLAQANPNEGFWEARSTAPKEQVFDPKQGKVVERADPMFKNRANVLAAKVKDSRGRVVEQYLVFNEDNPRAVRMAQSLKNLDAANLEGLLGTTAKATRYLAAMNTQYNPIFGLTNVTRDVSGAMLNLASTPLAGKQREVLGNILPALWGIYADARARRKGDGKGQAGDSEWARLYEDFRNAGGATGYRDQFRTSADRAQAIARALDPSSWAETNWGRFFTAGGRLKVPLEMARKAMAPVFHWLDDYNTAMENGTRLAAYKAALDAGMSKERAASLAKNLTTNFNRKGQAAQQVGALYAFFNASMQGTARIGETLFDMEPGQPKTLRLSSVGKRIVAGGVSLGVMQAMMLAAAGFDDEEPPDFIRERNLVIPNPMSEKGYITIPLPLGFNVLPNLGRIPTEFALGGFKKPAEHAVRLMGLFADTFNPIGSAGLSMQTLAPSVLDPFAALAENKDFSGRKIAKESFDQTTPGHALARDTASVPAKLLAEGINWLSGGTKHTRGVFSPTPDQIDYLVGQATGGVGREASKLQQSVVGVAQGDDVPWHKVPALGRFYGNAGSDSAKQSAYYRHLEDVQQHAAEVKGLRLEKKGEEASAYMRNHPVAGLHLAANAAQRDIRALQQRRRELEQQGAPREQVREAEQRVVARMERFSALAAARAQAGQ